MIDHVAPGAQPHGGLGDGRHGQRSVDVREQRVETGAGGSCTIGEGTSVGSIVNTTSWSRSP